MASHQQILESDRYLLYQLDQKTQNLLFVETQPSKIRAASFLDARFKDFKRQTLLKIPLAFALEWYCSLASNRTPGRYIFHVSFCGSTLLSRALESTHTISYKEPIALTELEQNLRQSEHQSSNAHSRQDLLPLLLSQFSKTNSSLRYIVKPSNLVNALIPEICSPDEDSRAIFLSMAPRNFLIAVLRGGSDRVDYVKRLNENFSAYSPAHASSLEEARANSPNEMQTVCRSVLLALVKQERIFSEAARLMAPDKHYCMHYEQLVRAPLFQLQQSSAALDLGLSDRDLEQSIANIFLRHSKEQSLNYDNEEATSIDAQVLAHYQPHINSALEWFEEQSFDTSDNSPTQY